MTTISVSGHKTSSECKTAQNGCSVVDVCSKCTKVICGWALPDYL